MMPWKSVGKTCRIIIYDPSNGALILMRGITPADIDPTVRLANYIRVPEGRRYGWRTIEDLELILIVSGRFLYERGSGPAQEVQPGQVLCIRPGEEHDFRHDGASEPGVISCIHGELLADGAWLNGDYRLEPEPALVTGALPGQVMHDLFRRCAEAFEGYERFRMPLVRAIVREIWIRLSRAWAGEPAGRLTPRMERMLAWLRAHLTEPVSRRDLAREFALTPEYVNALFKEELGTTPTQFIHRERVLLACRYIQAQGLSVKQAAARVGFNDQFYFSKVFKRIMGVPPSRI
jgi:AraC-like DNA-binding protein/mannose-6-phosphate isomerase-like protein (cupin superfamily)